MNLGEGPMLGGTCFACRKALGKRDQGAGSTEVALCGQHVNCVTLSRVKM